VRRDDYAGDWVMLRPNSEAAVRSAGIAARRVLTADTD
jgi:oxygen-dependent protoporphyrinogen oxidase